MSGDAPKAASSIAAVTCGECGAPMELRASGHRRFWGCTRFPECRGTHGAHPDGRPLGIPANKETKAARIRAHAAFDRLWNDGGTMTRDEAYRWLTVAMGRTGRVHMGELSTVECERVVTLCEGRTKEGK